MLKWIFRTIYELRVAVEKQKFRLSEKWVCRVNFGFEEESKLNETAVQKDQQ